MALTPTEENQLRELLRRSNATQAGKTVDQLARVESGGGVTDVVIRKTGGGLARASQDALIDSLLDNGVRSTGTRRTTADQGINHLMTRDATRSEITSMTNSRITNAQNTANSAVAANDATLQFARTVEGRAVGLEEWRNRVIDPSYSKKIGVIGPVFASNPVVQFGAMNPSGVGIEPRTHKFQLPMKKNPMVIFSMFGDVNYPRFELIEENGKITSFILFHQPTPGLWMAIGEQA